MVLHGQTLMVPAGMPTPDDKWAQDVATAFSATAVDGPLAAALRDSVGGAVDDALADAVQRLGQRRHAGDSWCRAITRANVVFKPK